MIQNMVMAKMEGEKSFGADLPVSLCEEIDAQVDERNHKKKAVVASALRLWLSLPTEIQARLLNKSLSDDSFIELINQIVDERIASGYEAGLKLVERQRKKPGRKD